MSVVKRFFARPDGVGAPLNIYMFSPRRLLAHLAGFVRDPGYTIARLRVMAYQLRHPDAPWLTAEVVAWLDRHLTPDKRGFEWGSGGSTVWFARRLGALVSVEHVPGWHADVSRRLADAGLGHVDYRLLDGDGPASPYVRAIADFPDAHFDFILVDGEQRMACMAAAAPKLRPGGLLVLDNADQFPPPPGVEGLRYAPTNNGVWRTDVYVRD